MLTCGIGRPVQVSIRLLQKQLSKKKLIRGLSLTTYESNKVCKTCIKGELVRSLSSARHDSLYISVAYALLVFLVFQFHFLDFIGFFIFAPFVKYTVKNNKNNKKDKQEHEIKQLHVDFTMKHGEIQFDEYCFQKSTKYMQC